MRLSSTGSFGSNDRPICPKCGAAMHLIRRGRIRHSGSIDELLYDLPKLSQDGSRALKCRCVL